MPCTTVSINEERIRAFSSLAGMEHCYFFFENKNYLAFSNRIGIFSCLENLTIDYYALSKLILKGHMIDESTCYHEVKKTSTWSMYLSEIWRTHRNYLPHIKI